MRARDNGRGKCANNKEMRSILKHVSPDPQALIAI